MLVNCFKNCYLYIKHCVVKIRRTSCVTSHFSTPPSLFVTHPHKMSDPFWCVTLFMDRPNGHVYKSLAFEESQIVVCRPIHIPWLELHGFLPGTKMKREVWLLRTGCGIAPVNKLVNKSPRRGFSGR